MSYVNYDLLFADSDIASGYLRIVRNNSPAMSDLFQNIGGIVVPASRKLRRNDDPETSNKSAQTVSEFGHGHQRKIYETLLLMTDGTFYEIAEKSGLEPASVWRRLNELEKTKHIETTGEERRGPTGRLCRVWRALPFSA